MDDFDRSSVHHDKQMMRQLINKKQIYRNVVTAKQHYAVALICIAGLLQACIEEDMSTCLYGVEIEYHICLQTDFKDVLAREFTTPMEIELSQQLQTPLSAIFTEEVKDINFSFYAKSKHKYDEVYDMNDSHHTHNFLINSKNYLHFAFANLAAEQSIERINQSKTETCHIAQIAGDTIDSHSVAQYAASKEIAVQPVNSPFSMELSMQNAACVLALDPNGNKVKSIRSYIINTANAFHAQDRVFKFDNPQVIRMNPLHTDDMYAMYGLSFPSRDTYPTTPPADVEPAIWRVHAYIALENGAVAESILSVKKPLKPEDLYIIKGVITSKGGIQSSSRDVGISVNLDWEQGGEYNPEI